MAYRIIYGAQTPVRKSCRERKPGLGLAAGVFVLFFALGLRLWGDAALPESAAVRQTDGAAFRLVQQLRQGEPLGDAVSAFCREIVQDAGVFSHTP